MKIFGIGLNKTGTTTLGEAGRLFGLRTKSWDRALFHETMVEGRREKLREAVDAFDLFDDFPYPLLYEELDDTYPGSKFVLTRRITPEAWLRSLKAHAMRASISTQTHKIVYGFQFPHGREAAFLAYYDRHLTQARAYFADRRNDFIEICWEEEKDLDRLAAFLGCEASGAPVPRANARARKTVNPLRYAYNVGRRLVQNRSAP